MNRNEINNNRSKRPGSRMSSAVNCKLNIGRFNKMFVFVSDVPELMVLQTQSRKELPIETHFFTQCVPSWSDRSEMTFHVMKAVLLYTLPLIFMSVAYCQIVRVLWRSDNIPGHTETMNYYGTGTCNNSKSSHLSCTIHHNQFC
jgi:hypothetical protein